MKAIVVTDQSAGTGGMELAEPNLGVKDRWHRFRSEKSLDIPHTGSAR